MSCSVRLVGSGRVVAAGCLPIRLTITVAAGTSHTIDAGKTLVRSGWLLSQGTDLTGHR
jgi:hypothetical protein